MMPAAQAETADREVSPEFPDAEEPSVTIPSLLAPIRRGEHFEPSSSIGNTISSGVTAAVVEIPLEASQALQSWDRKLANVDRQFLAMQFCRAAIEVLRLASPQAAPEQFEQLVDSLHAMGEHHGLSIEVVQNLIVAAAQASPDQRPAEQGRPPRRIMDGLLPLEAPPVFITPAHWSNEVPPPVDWLVHQRIPRGDVTTLHGDGGAGKTDIACQLAEACARGAGYWLGHEIARGPVVILSAEEPDRELRRRIWRHGQRDGFRMDDLNDLHVWFPNDVAGAVFARRDHSGIMHPTPLFCSMEAAIAQIAPVAVIVDNVAAIFTGNQNDRVMVRSFVNLWRKIARQASHPAVVLLDHPSLSGLTNGNGRGGNMDWRNAVRSALYLRVPDAKAEADRGIRILETQKSNYGPTGQPVRLQWSDGGLALEHAPSALHRLAKDAECEETFLRLLDERGAQGRPVGEKYASTYAPKVFAKLVGNGGFTAVAFAKAMERLFATSRITLQQTGPVSKRRAHIIRAIPSTLPRQPKDLFQLPSNAPAHLPTPMPSGMPTPMPTGTDRLPTGCSPTPHTPQGLEAPRAAAPAAPTTCVPTRYADASLGQTLRLDHQQD
jgi:RecA-family ATPase